MSLNSVCIVKHSRNEMAMLDVHVLEPISLLLSVQLVEQSFLQIDSLNVEDLDQTLVVALIAQ